MKNPTYATFMSEVDNFISNLSNDDLKKSMDMSLRATAHGTLSKEPKEIYMTGILIQAISANLIFSKICPLSQIPSKKLKEQGYWHYLEIQ